MFLPRRCSRIVPAHSERSLGWAPLNALERLEFPIRIIGFTSSKAPRLDQVFRAQHRRQRWLSAAPCFAAALFAGALIRLWFRYGNRVSGLRLKPLLDILHLG